MRQIIANQETGLGGCLLAALLFLVLGGWLTSAILNVGKSEEGGAEGVAVEPTVPERLRIDLPEEEDGDTETGGAPAPSDGGSDSDREPRDGKETGPDTQVAPPLSAQERIRQRMCNPIMDRVARVEACDFLDPGGTVRSTLFLRISSAPDEELAAAVALGAWDALADGPVTPGVFAVESTRGSIMVPRKTLRVCDEAGGDRLRCVRRDLVRIENR